MREDQVVQARYLIEQWREIYEQSAGNGMVGNSIGGLTFQWTGGIVAKGPTDHNNLYELYPRAAYYALQQAYTLDPYARGTNATAIREHLPESGSSPTGAPPSPSPARPPARPVGGQGADRLEGLGLGELRDDRQRLRRER